MKTTFATIALLLITGTTCIAQTKRIENVLRAKGRGSGTILKNGELGGYYSFFETDKVDRKSRAYTAVLLDANLNGVGEIEMVKPKRTYLLESVFNGEAFMFLFLEDKNVIFETYGADGKSLGKKTFEDKTKYELMRVQVAMAGGEEAEVNASIFPYGTQGFIKQSLAKEGKKRGYSLTAYDNNLKELWHTGSKNNDMHESMDVLEVSDNHVLGTMIQQKGSMDMPDDMTLLMWSSKDGSKVFEKKLIDQGKKLAVLNAFIDEANNQVLLIGEYFGPKDNMWKDKSQGLFAQRLNLDGVMVATEYYDWKLKVASFIPDNEDGKKDRELLYFHKVVMGKDGSAYVVGERFKKVASAAGIASRALGGGGGLSEVRIDDMVVLTLDPALQLKDYKVFEKGRSRFNLGEGTLSMSAMMMGRVLKSWGAFDYEFTTTDKANDRFFTTYIDYSREKGEDGKKVGTYVGTIVNDKGALTVDKYDVKSGARYYRIMPAKPGNILVWEYFKKEKAISLRLEKVNF